MAKPSIVRARLVRARWRSGAVALGAVAILSTLAVPAAAVIPSPATPSNVRVSAVSASAVTVVARSAHATRFVLYASTAKADLYFVNLFGGHASAARRSVSSRTSTMTISRLRYTTAPYYFRVVVYNGSHRRVGPAIDSIGLRPATPSALRAVGSTAGSYLTWGAGAATGFKIVQATDAAMTKNRVGYTIRGQLHQFTPLNLVKGRGYYFRVQALNNGTGGTASVAAHLTARTAEQSTSVLSFNILEATADGQAAGGQTVAPWSQRRPVVAGLIMQTKADLVAIQEAAAWTGAVRGPREIDSLQSALGGTYALARTETPPSESFYLRTGNYILYKASAFRTIGAGGHWFIGDNHTAAYQVLVSRTTGAKVLFVSPHLIVGAGAAYDAKREAETNSLLRQARAAAASAHASIVFAGDFNTNTSPSGHKFDGPGIAMRNAHVASARDVAQSHSNEKYNSANLYLRTPPADGLSIDYIFAPAGVGIYSWRLILNLTHGKFVGPMASDHNPLYALVQLPY